MTRRRDWSICSSAAPSCIWSRSLKYPSKRLQRCKPVSPSIDILRREYGGRRRGRSGRIEEAGIEARSKRGKSKFRELGETDAMASLSPNLLSSILRIPTESMHKGASTDRRLFYTRKRPWKLTSLILNGLESTAKSLSAAGIESSSSIDQMSVMNVH